MSALPLDEFTWLDQSLMDPPDTWDDCMNDLERTAWIINKLRVCEHNDTRALLDDTQEIIRLFQAKTYRNNNHENKIATHKLNNAQQTYAMAMYLFYDKKSIESCNTCKSEKSEGPGMECVGPIEGRINGACTNCYYSGRASKCSFAIDLKKAKQLEYFKNVEPFPGFKQRHITDATDEDLHAWLKIINDAIEKRTKKKTKSAPPTPHKETPSRKRKA